MIERLEKMLNGERTKQRRCDWKNRKKSVHFEGETSGDGEGVGRIRKGVYRWSEQESGRGSETSGRDTSEKQEVMK